MDFGNLLGAQLAPNCLPKSLRCVKMRPKTPFRGHPRVVLKPTCFKAHCQIAPGHHFERFWMRFGRIHFKRYWMGFGGSLEGLFIILYDFNLILTEDVGEGLL